MQWEQERGVPSRRGFLQVAGGAMAAASLGWPSGVAAAERFGEWPIGIQTYSLRKFSVSDALRHVQGLGVHNVELFNAHLALDASDEQIQQMLQTLRTANIQLRAHGVNDFTADHAKNRRVFEFAKRAGIRNITANPQPDSFDSLDQLVAEYDIRICIHNHGPGALYDKLTDVTTALRGHHRNLGACIDTGHTLRSNEDPVEWVKELGPRVFALHIKDVAEKQKQTHDVIIGQSFLDLVGLFKALKRIGFPADGAISLEYESSPDNPIDDIKQCLAAAEQAIRQA